MRYETWLHDTILGSFQRTCARLVDPPIHDVDRALRLLVPLADTLEGFAIGCAIGHVATAVRGWSGEAAGRAVLARLRPHIRGAACVDPDELAPTLAGELAVRMHRRLSHMPAAAFIAEAGAEVSPVAMQDTSLAPRLAAEIETGWQHYRSVLLGEPLPTTSSLWHLWDRRVRGKRDEILRDYVLRVA
jgi:hypothetical protein